MTRRNGACACGAVTVTATLPDAYHACHCDTCRHWTGSAFVAISGAEPEIAGPVGIWDSSDWAVRGFCQACGTALFYRLKDGGGHSFSLGLFGDLDGLRLTEHYFSDRKPGHLDFAHGARLTAAETIAKFT